MGNLRVLAVDDEPLALVRARQVLARIPGVELVGAASGCAEGEAMARALKPDVVLLDISMRDGSGFDLLDRLGADLAAAVIFVTAFDVFAVRAFESSAVDYVLKPISVERLGEAIARARKRLEAADATTQLAELQATLANLRGRLRDEAVASDIWIRGSSGAMVRVMLDDVEWLQSEDDYVRLHTRNGSHLTRGSIRSLAPKFDSEKFVRVHRNALVRRTAIRAVHRGTAGVAVELTSGARIPAGRVYARQLRTELAV
jgi:two-component system LytT family response regulator